MKNKRDNDLIWEAFIAENVPSGIGGMFSLNDDEPELDDPSTRSRADDAFTQKGALVNWFEGRVKNILDE